MSFYPPRKNNFLQQEVQPQQRTSGFSNWGGSYTPPRTNYNNWGNNNQNTVQNQQQSPLPGKIISSLDDIKPNDIPGDGQVAWFPADDYSCIIARGWATSGDRIEMRKYVPEETANNPDQPSIESILMGMAQKLNQMEQLLIANGFTLPDKSEAKAPNVQNDISEKKV